MWETPGFGAWSLALLNPALLKPTVRYWVVLGLALCNLGGCSFDRAGLSFATAPQADRGLSRLDSSRAPVLDGPADGAGDAPVADGYVSDGRGPVGVRDGAGREDGGKTDLTGPEDGTTPVDHSADGAPRDGAPADAAQVDTSSPDASPPDTGQPDASPVLTCDQIFGGEPGYELCRKGPTFCAFYVVLNQRSCAEACSAHGRICISSVNEGKDDDAPCKGLSASFRSCSDRSNDRICRCQR